MNGWITFWTWVYIIGCSSGALLVLIILPLGVRDLFRLYRVLNAAALWKDDSDEKGKESER